MIPIHCLEHRACADDTYHNSAADRNHNSADDTYHNSADDRNYNSANECALQ